MVREKRKERKENKNVNKGFGAFLVFCVFRGPKYV